MPAQTYEFTTRDVEYLRHGDRRFIARLFIPQGQGPFPRKPSPATAWRSRRWISATRETVIRPRLPTSTTASAGSKRTPAN